MCKEQVINLKIVVVHGAETRLILILLIFMLLMLLIFIQVSSNKNSHL